ncbi:MAG TPA: hypothetical protein VK102_07020 [Sphingobacterium sp.]|nr:hypothetical protein [Sphingobacterium sp.]
MKNNLIFLLFVAFFFVPVSNATAQLNNEHAVGLRFGASQGLNYRYTLSSDRAIEGLLSIQSNSKSKRFRLAGLYEHFYPLHENFNWYWGYGGSVGSYTRKSHTRVLDNGHTEIVGSRSELALSVDGVAGIQYDIPNAPLALSLDVKPSFDFMQESSIRLFNFGFSIRYLF